MKKYIISFLLVVVIIAVFLVFKTVSTIPSGKDLTWSSQSDNKTWVDAKSYCMSLGSGWRLPTKMELEIVLDNQFPSGSELGMNSGGFQGRTIYWSGTELSSDNVWGTLTVNQSASLPINKSLSHSVRCVH